MENKSKHKNKKRLLILVALVGVMGIGGVVAATSISINGGVAISLGAGYTTATTCDSAVTITTTNAYNASTNLYNISELNVANVNVNGATAASCGAKTMQLAVVTTGDDYNTTWSLPSSATPYVFIFGASGTVNTVSGNNYYASSALTPFDIATLSTVALSIS
jgi:hypothetical protein